MDRLWVRALGLIFDVLTRHEYKIIDEIKMNYNSVRPKGERLKTFGGRSSGHESIKKMFDKLFMILGKKSKDKVNLKPLDCLDIANIIGENVVSGGVRRTSEIGLFNADNENIKTAKNGLYQQEDGEWKINKDIEHRQMSNNSIYYEEKPDREQLHWHIKQMRYSGEPGFVNAKEGKRRRENFKGVNPCAEILLDGNGVCNLVSLNVKAFVKDGKLDREDLLKSQKLNVRSAYRMALVEFELPEWDYVNARDRLVGLSLTGWQDAMNALDWENEKEKQAKLLEELRTTARSEAEKVAEKYNDNIPELVTTVKPEGCITKDHTRVTEQGILFIDELDSKIDNYSEDCFVDLNNYSSRGNKISKVYNNGKEEIIRLTLKNGRKLDLTHNHPLSINDSWIEAKDIELNDVIDFKLGNYNKITHSDLEDVDTSDFRKGENGMNEYKIPKTMNEDLAWLIGAYLANGSFPNDKDRKNQHRIKFHCGNYEVHKKVQRIWKELFEVETKIVVSSDRDSYTQDFASVKLRRWFKENGIDKESNTNIERIPKKIRTSSKKDIISFIVGYADNDGCFYSESFSIDSADKKLIRNIQEVGEAVGLSFNTKRSGYSDNTMYKNHLSRVYTLEEVIDYINDISVKAQEKPLKNSDGYKYVQNPYKVVKKEVIADKKTYGVQVERDHWYYQGGLKSHNTQTQMPTVSSGLHYNHSAYYIRRVRISANDPLVKVAEDLDWNVKDEVGDNENTKVLEFPVKAPKGKSKKDVNAIEQLETYKLFMEYYVDHNASITVHVREDEWEDVEEWLWNNWDSVVGISFIPYNDSFYDLMPYEEISEEEYNKMVENMNSFRPHLVNQYEREHQQERELEQDECEDGICPVR